MDKVNFNRPHASEHHNVLARMEAFIMLNEYIPESFVRTYSVHWHLAYAPRKVEHREDA